MGRIALNVRNARSSLCRRTAPETAASGFTPRSIPTVCCGIACFDQPKYSFSQSADGEEGYPLPRVGSRRARPFAKSRACLWHFLQDGRTLRICQLRAVGCRLLWMGTNREAPVIGIRGTSFLIIGVETRLSSGPVLRRARLASEHCRISDSE